MYRTNDPVADAERYYEAQETQYALENECAICECCGRPCGAEEHYDVFGRVACSKECAKEIIAKDEDLYDDVLDEWLEDNVIEAGHEYKAQYE